MRIGVDFKEKKHLYSWRRYSDQPFWSALRPAGGHLLMRERPLTISSAYWFLLVTYTNRILQLWNERSMKKGWSSFKMARWWSILLMSTKYTPISNNIKTTDRWITLIISLYISVLCWETYDSCNQTKHTPTWQQDSNSMTQCKELPRVRVFPTFCSHV